MTDIDVTWMDYAISLARRGQKATKTNPLVGSVIVYDGKILGEGHHARYGGPHAEVHALAAVSEDKLALVGLSTWYVTLEPCCHHGKTPPCVDLILAHRPARVVIGTLDPNPLVAGRGARILAEAGIEVCTMKDHLAARQLIAPFVANLQKRPFVILKVAQSKDFYMGQPDRQVWLSDRPAQILSHSWRTEVDAILVGKNTALIDRPQLTPRLVEGIAPTRIVLAPISAFDPAHPLLQPEAKTIFIHTDHEENDGGHVITWKLNPKDIPILLSRLFDSGINTLLVEGGATVLQAFLDANLWDEARIIQTPQLLGSGIKAPMIQGHLSKKQKLYRDQLIYIFSKNPLENGNNTIHVINQVEN